MVILALMLFASPAPASEHLDLNFTSLPPKHDAMSAMFGKAEDKIVAFAERAQHLGSRKSEWLWVTPILGSTVGAQVAFTLR